MKTLTQLAFAVVLLLAAAGCGPKNSLVGTWQGTLPAGGQTATMTITFNADGTETQKLEGGGQKLEIKARYTAKDGTLTHTIEQGTINGQKMQPKVTSGSFDYKVEGDKLILTEKGTSTSLTLTRTAGT